MIASSVSPDAMSPLSVLLGDALDSKGSGCTSPKLPTLYPRCEPGMLLRGLGFIAGPGHCQRLAYRQAH